ncbi:MAG: glycosyltransferase, partial [Planctomycetota bacterium]
MSGRVRVCHILEATLGGTARHLELVARMLPARGVDLLCVVSPVRSPTFPERLEAIQPRRRPQPEEAPPQTDTPAEAPAETEAAGDGDDADEAAPPPAPVAPTPTTVLSLPMRREISPLEDLSAYIALRRLLQKERPDVVHTHASKAGFLGRAAARSCGIPVVHTPHVLSMEWSTSLLYRKLEQRAARWTDRLVVLNDQQERLAREDLGLPEARIVRIDNGVDPNEFYPASPSVFARARDRLG